MSSSDEEAVLVKEDEFEGRDDLGLQPDSGETATESKEMRKYFLLLLVVMPLIAQLLSWGLYFLCDKCFGMHEVLAKKFEFLYNYDLGYVYLALWLVAITRDVVICNANGSRAPARVDRPDQHVYKIMASSGPLASAPYVMMAGTGPQGRFNRAQRGVFNFDEAMPLLVANLLLVGGIFGPVTVFPVLLIAFGRILFAFKYKAATNARGAGFLPAAVGEKLLGGLVLLSAIKSIFFKQIPF